MDRPHYKLNFSIESLTVVAPLKAHIPSNITLMAKEQSPLPIEMMDMELKAIEKNASDYIKPSLNMPKKESG